MKFQGTLTKWNDERGFGFIKPESGGQDIFVNIKAFERGEGRPVEGARLSFAVEVGPEGKKRAVSVQHLRPAKSAATRPPAREKLSRSSAPWPAVSLVALCGFPLVYLATAFLWGVSIYVAAAYLVLSVVTFVTYQIDKSAAESNSWRVAEANLHVLAFVGGWPGATLAQQLLRHKSKKAEFRAVHWVMTFGNIGAFIFLASQGALRLGGL